MKFLRNILIIVVPVYYIIVWIRNKLYDLSVLPSKSYDFPIISVGNLSVGGTGKTPMIEYLIRLLKNDYQLATLSRGYKRSGSGFQLADQNSSVENIGDEPFQFYTKFKSIQVGVDGNRQRGISSLLSGSNSPELILLDDAFQHRKVKAGFSILLTTYDKLYVDDMLLPTGDLREAVSGAKRADVIIVTKCPESIGMNDKDTIRQKLKPQPYQHLFFSSIVYSQKVYSAKIERSLDSLKDVDLSLVTGIANAEPLVNYLKASGLRINHLEYQDHHKFSEKDLKSIRELECVLTTEKDFMRLMHQIDPDQLYYLPIEIKIDESSRFEALIREYLQNYAEADF